MLFIEKVTRECRSSAVALVTQPAVVNEQTAKLQRLSGEERTVMVANAKLALKRMIEITEGAQ